MSDNPIKSTQPSSEDAALTRMELTISTLLRAGILVSLALVLLGVILMFTHHPEYLHSRDALNHLASGDYRFPTTMGSILTEVVEGRGRGIVMLGVFVLFLTPVLRVAASVITFAFEKDWTFAAITSIVLSLMILSLVLGKAG